jgi:hypothetical protein
MTAQEDLTETSRWATSAEGLAACREAWAFAQRTGIPVTLTQVGSLLAAGHLAEINEMRRLMTGQPGKEQETRP